MRDIFIPTQNFQKFNALCEELLRTAAGIEMAAVLGRAGRGKTTASERVVTQNQNAVYVRFEERLSYVGLIREVAFAVAGVRPSRTQECVEEIKEELAKKRRIIMVDEADRMSMKHLNTMRDFHDTCKVPVILIGEEPLRAKLARERRLVSRVRELMTFEAVNQPDIVVFYRKALALDVPAPQAARLLKHAGGDFRHVVKDALAVEKLMKASGLKAITEQLIDEVVKQNGREGME